jgi:hypothetical protein
VTTSTSSPSGEQASPCSSRVESLADHVTLIPILLNVCDSDEDDGNIVYPCLRCNRDGNVASSQRRRPAACPRHRHQHREFPTEPTPKTAAFSSTRFSTTRVRTRPHELHEWDQIYPNCKHPIRQYAFCRAKDPGRRTEDHRGHRLRHGVRRDNSPSISSLTSAATGTHPRGGTAPSFRGDPGPPASGSPSIRDTMVAAVPKFDSARGCYRGVFWALLCATGARPTLLTYGRLTCSSTSPRSPSNDLHRASHFPPEVIGTRLESSEEQGHRVEGV